MSENLDDPILDAHNTISIALERRKCYGQDNNMNVCSLRAKCQHFWNPIDPGMPGYLQMMMPPTPWTPEGGCKEFWDVNIPRKQSVEIVRKIAGAENEGGKTHTTSNIFHRLAKKANVIRGEDE